MNGYITANQVGLGATGPEVVQKVEGYAEKLGLTKYLDKLGLTTTSDAPSGTAITTPAPAQPEPETIPTWGKVAIGAGIAFLLLRAIR